MLATITNGKQEFIFKEAGVPDIRAAKETLRAHEEEVFGGRIISIPTMKMYTNHGYMSTYRNDKGCSRNFEKVSENSMFTEGLISGEVADRDYEEMTELVVKRPDGTEEIVLYGLNMYEEGFVLNTGKTSTNFMGVSFASYFDKITSRHYKLASRSSARHFKDISDVLKYVEKNENHFKYAVETYGYCWSFEYASDMFKEFYHASMSDKKKSSFEKNLKELETLLESINEEAEEKEPERFYGSTIEEEAIFRMKEMNIWENAITAFKNGKVMISDVGGIFFDLDDFAKEFVEKIKSDGSLPYLVVKKGNMYSVLYVSKYKEDWPMERYDRKSEFIAAAAVMSDGYGLDCVDYGSIGVRLTTAGGLDRFA